jgi:hypothetical protein
MNGFSRYALALAITIFPAQAFALDFTPDASREISDPAYLPLQGWVYGNSQYSYETVNSHGANDLGVQQSSHRTKDSIAGQTIAYGVTDDFTLQLSDNYEWDRTRTDDYTSATTDLRSTGLTDPTLRATWRAVDQKTHPLNWDLIASYAPNLINADSASTADTGTVARGGQAASAGTALSYETKSFTVYGSGLATYLGSRNTLDQTTDVTTDYDSSWQYQLSLNTQTRFSELWSVNAGATETLSNHADAIIYSTPAKDIISEPANTTALNAAINLEVISDRLVVSLMDTYTFHGDAHTDFITAPASDTSTVDEKENTVGLALRYQFN